MSALLALLRQTAMTRGSPLAGAIRTSRGCRRMTDFDPELTSAGSKCRTAASPRCRPICYALTVAFGAPDAICPTETPRVHHAARRRGGVSARGARAADDESIPGWLVV